MRPWPVCAALAMLGLGQHAQASDPGSTELKRLDEAIAQADRAFFDGDSAACRARLEEVRATAWEASNSSGLGWAGVMSRCLFWNGGAQRPDEGPVDTYLWANLRLSASATPAAINALWDPWLRRMALRSDVTPSDRMSFYLGYRNALNSMGLREQGDEVLWREVRELLSEAAAVPAKPTTANAEAGLMALAQQVYGAWQLHRDTRQFHQEFSRVLGPAHPATLVMQRALAYGERFLGRAQSAVDLADLAVKLVVEHHPENERLRVGLTAERSACLATAGRWAEAMADGLWVLDMLLQRDPLPLEGLVRMYYNLAGMALEMGDHAAAIGYADRSIDYAHRTGKPNMLIEARVPAATREVARLMLGEPGAAQALQQALEPTRVGGEMHIGALAFALVQHAARVGDQAQLDWAVDFMNLHIERYRTPFHSDRAMQPLMGAWRHAGIDLQRPEVRGSLELALATSLAGRSLGTMALTHFSLARHLAPAQPDEAVLLYKRGANALQQLRTGLPSGEAELHRAWLAAHEDDLRRFIGLLIDRGRLVEAEQAVMFLRDEEIVEYTRRAPSKRASSTKALPFTAGEADRQAGFEALAVRVQQAAAAADERADGRRTIHTRFRYRDEDAANAAAAFQREVGELLLPARAAAFSEPQARGAATRILPRGLGRLTYFVRPDGIDVVLQQGRVFRSRTVPIAREELNRRVQALRVALISPQRDAMAASKVLYDTLVGPIGPWLQAGGATHLQIVPDASLRYVPFAALHDGHRWLVQRFAVSTDLSGSAAPTSTHDSTRSTPRGVFALGRSAADADHAALPGVESELAAVAAAAQSATGGHGAVMLNEAFTAASLRLGLEGQPAVVHVASHFELSPAGEDKSYLLLGDGQRLSLADLRQLPWDGVQLALLSACDSAVTLEAGHGRELVGFATALLSAGVRNVVASLWRVSDGATAQWMAMFYEEQARRQRQRQLALHPHTLAQTQRRWLREHEGTHLTHPHYWAAFGWIGSP